MRELASGNGHASGNADPNPGFSGMSHGCELECML
jgi:hypothetical protein